MNIEELEELEELCDDAVKALKLKKLYVEYMDKTNELETRLSIMCDMCRIEPKLIEWLDNRVDTCFGPHIVYVVHMRYTPEDPQDEVINMIKIGYTKNTVKKRFSEKRYEGMGKVTLVKTFREEILQAKGAKDMEKELQDSFKDCHIETNLKFPGKGEMYGEEYLDIILNSYDDNYPKHRETVGFKSPN